MVDGYKESANRKRLNLAAAESGMLELIKRLPPKKRRSGLVTRLRTGPAEGWLLANVHLGLMHLERRIQNRLGVFALNSRLGRLNIQGHGASIPSSCGQVRAITGSPRAVHACIPGGLCPFGLRMHESRRSIS